MEILRVENLSKVYGKEETEVKSLVDYIESMETKLGDMSQELSDMHLQVGGIGEVHISGMLLEILCDGSLGICHFLFGDTA